MRQNTKFAKLDLDKRDKNTVPELELDYNRWKVCKIIVCLDF